ncbi:DUF975 family protein [Bifidobacterium breve]|uniref:DUF975 family protein n=1 Tax=Bifidobacterium breve TaxID=1685 RepID=UPI000D0EC373
MERKALKAQARKTLKRSYWLIVIACLFAAFLGAEYGSSLIAIHTNSGTAQTSVQTDAQTTAEAPGEGYYASGPLDILMEITSGQGSDARDQVNSNEKAIAALGRSRGVLSAALNSFSSGSFILSVADAATSVIHAQNIVISILVIVALLGTVAFPLFVVQVFRVVLRRIMLEARIYEKVPLRRFLYPLQSKRWVRMAWTMMVENAYLMLWWLTFVGGIIKTYSYFLVPYIVAENPNISANQAISLSRRMMKGHKWECFVAQVSFLGWYLLNGATVGLSGIFYSNGYNAAFFAEYYAYLRAVAKENGIEGAELLCDDYLYVKPSVEQVADVYTDVAQAVASAHASDTTVAKSTGFVGWLSDWFGITLKQNGRVDAWQQHEAELNNIEKAENILHVQTYPGRLAPAAMDFRLAKRMNLNPQRSYTVLNLVMMFFIFCFVGWVWEVTLALITEGMFVNRGTLHGPWLPIYGTGGIIILILLKKLRPHPALLFVGTVVLCGCLEYFSSWYLELTHDGQRWWDYTGYFLNLNGRICAEGLLAFGLGGLATVYLLAPALDNLLARAHRRIMAVVAIVLLVAYVGDNIYSSIVPNTGAGITDYKGSSSSAGS